MRKYFTLTTILLTTLFSWGQDMPLGVSQQYKIDNNYHFTAKIGFWGRKGSRRICDIWSKFNVDGKEIRNFSENNFLKEIVEPFSVPPNRVAYKGYLKRRNFFGYCSGDDESFEYDEPIKLCKKFYDRKEGDGNAASLSSSLEVYVVPLHTLSAEKINNIDNTYLPIGQKINLNAKKGFPSDLYHYEYATEKKIEKRRKWFGYEDVEVYNWEKLSPTFKKENGSVLSVSAEDVLRSEEDAKKHIGKPVYFRVVSYDKDNPSNVCSSSNIVNLTVTRSAPSIVRTEIIEKPKCFGDTKTVVKLYFNRKLHGDINQYRSNRQDYIGETLSIWAEKDGVSVLQTQDYTEQLLQNSETNSIEITTESSGNYTIQTLGNLYYKDKNGQQKSVSVYTDGDKNRYSLPINIPTKLTAQITHKKDNICHGEHKGTISVSVSGGTPPYKYIKNGNTIAFTGSTFTIENLSEGTHSFTVTDANDCKVLDSQGKEIVFSQVITAPSAVSILSESKKDVSGYGLNNGEIRVQIGGGTPFSTGTAYKVVLKGTKGNEITTFTTTQNTNILEVFYNQLPPDTYTLSVADQNNCSITPRNFVIEQPDPLVVRISEENPISCNPLNDDPNNDPTLNKNGVLLAHAQGGVVPYRYQWNRVSGTTVTPLLGENEATLKGLTQGTYQVNITDQNNNQTSGTFTIQFPERLLLTTQGSEISCSAPTSGVAKAIVNGGTPPYSYQWSDGQTAQTASGLSAGKYFVIVTDNRGCSLQSQVVLSYPEAVKIDNEQITHTTCHNGNNGSISVVISGGKGTTNIRWYNSENQEITKNISSDRKTIRNLSAGKYRIVLRDESDCPAIEKEFEITHPDAILVNLPHGITLCQGDSYTFDLSEQHPSSTFEWFDASGNLLGTDATFNVSEQGEYQVEITNAVGCKATAKVQVRQSSQVLDVDFLVATTSYYDYTLKLINLSKNIDSFQWQFPDDVIVVSQNKQEAEVRFTKEGTYVVGFQGTLGSCNKLIQKTLYVEKDRVGLSQEPTFEKQIESFLIVPNPNSGNYQLHIKLNKASKIRVRLVDLLGRELFTAEEFPTNTEFILPFNKPTLSAGQYIILLETESDVLSQKMIVK